MDWLTLRETVVGLYNTLHDVQREYFHIWKDFIVFTWRWWAALGLIVLPWTIWIIARKRNSTCRLLFCGAIIAILSSFIDAVGVSLHLWSYPVTVIPLMPSYLPFDLSSMPVATMLWLQFFPKTKLLWKTLIYAATSAFIFEPICVWTGLVVEDHWSFFYSFFILCGMYLLAYWLSKRRSFNDI